MTLLEKLFSFQGRLRRRDYWILTISLTLLNATLIFIIQFSLGTKISVIFSFLTIWPALAINSKRFHDRGQSAFFQLLLWAPLLFVDGRVFISYPVAWSNVASMFMALISLGFLVNLGVLDGTPGKNRFGPSPKDSI